MTMISIFAHICHQLPERTLIINGKLLPLCARCTGIYSGFIVGFAYQFLNLRNVTQFPSISLSSFLAATIGWLAIDGLGEKVELWNLSNNVRMLTGLFFGSSISIILLPLFNFFFTKHPTYSNIKAKDYSFILILMSFLFVIRDFEISYNIYIITSLLGLIGIYTIINLTFAGMVFQLNKKMINIKNMAVILVVVSIMFMGEGILLKFFR